MKHRRQATGRRTAASGARLVAIAVLLVTLIGVVSMPTPGSGGASPVASSSVPPASGRVLVGAFSDATPISSAFWGINVQSTNRFNSTDAASVAATPVTFVRFPGGNLGEEFNYTSGIITNITGAQSRSETSTQAFITACQRFHCNAILQLPAEIDQPGTAAYYAAYVVHTLGYQPAYWEIGNDPSGWTHFNVSWSKWATERGGNTTPAPFATLVQTYIKAVLAVDPAAKFLALGAGAGSKNYAKSWVEELARVDGHALSGISVHSYIEGGPSNPTDAQLFANLNGPYSLSPQVSADRSYITAACPTCTNLGVFVSEINAAEVSPYNQLLPSFAGTLYLAAETVQGLALEVANLDWFAYDCHYTGAWSQEPQKWQMQYYLFSDLMTHLENETLPTTVTGPSTLYAMATYDGSSLALLLVNVNTTTSVQLNLSAAGFSPAVPLTQYLWVNGTPLPVETQLPAGESLVLPPLSTAVLVGPSRAASLSFPVAFTESGLPLGSNWSVTLNGTTHSSTSPTLGFQEPNGTFSFAVRSPSGYLAAPVNGSVTVSGAPGSVPIVFSANSTPAFAATFVEAGLPPGTPWGVTVNGSSSAATSNTIAFWENNGSYNFSVAEVPGFRVGPDSGMIVIEGNAVNLNLTFAPTGRSYDATFSETGLVPGLRWYVTVGGTSVGASAPSPVVVGLPNGTFAFAVGSVPGYFASPAGGWVTLDGAGTTVAVTYVLSSSSGPNRIYMVEGGVTASNGSAVPGLGLTLIFRGGAPPVEWLNLTTDSAGRFTASGLNLSGNLSTVQVDSPEYQVTLTNVAWRASGAVNVTVVLQAVPGRSPPGGHAPSLVSLAIIGLAVTAVILCGAAVQAARRDRRMARYREYFAHPPR